MTAEPTGQSLEETVEILKAAMKERSDAIVYKPTRIMFPGAVRHWLDEKGYHVEDVIDMVKGEKRCLPKRT